LTSVVKAMLSEQDNIKWLKLSLSKHRYSNYLLSKKAYLFQRTLESVIMPTTSIVAYKYFRFPGDQV